jgi:integrase
MERLPADGHVSAATQNQALSAILFLYRAVLDDPLPWIGDIVRARRSEHVPVVLTPAEARMVIEETEGVSRLVVQLLYGSGLRLLECLRLRIKDLGLCQA